MSHFSVFASSSSPAGVAILGELSTFSMDFWGVRMEDLRRTLWDPLLPIPSLVENAFFGVMETLREVLCADPGVVRPLLGVVFSVSSSRSFGPFCGVIEDLLRYLWVLFRDLLLEVPLQGEGLCLTSSISYSCLLDILVTIDSTGDLASVISLPEAESSRSCPGVPVAMLRGLKGPLGLLRTSTTLLGREDLLRTGALLLGPFDMLSNILRTFAMPPSIDLGEFWAEMFPFTGVLGESASEESNDWSMLFRQEKIDRRSCASFGVKWIAPDLRTDLSSLTSPFCTPMTSMTCPESPVMTSSVTLVLAGVFKGDGFTLRLFNDDLRLVRVSISIYI